MLNMRANSINKSLIFLNLKSYLIAIHLIHAKHDILFD